MQLILLSLLFFIPLLSVLYLLFLSLAVSNNIIRNSHNTKNGGFKAYPFFGTLPEFLANRHRFLDWTTAILAGHPSHTSIFFRPGKVHGVITANPMNVEYIVKTNFSNYPKGPRFISYLHDFLGSGIFNVDNDLWRIQRKTASFEFNKRSLKSFILNSVRSEIENRLIPFLRRISGSGRVIDLQDILERFAFDNVCMLAFNVDPCCLAGDGSSETNFMQAFAEATTLSSGRFMYAIPGLWKIKKFLNVGSEKKLKESIKIVHDFANNIIQSRFHDESSSDNDDLLSRFISSFEVQEKQNHLLLRDVVISFILAGRDTTSSGLSWLFWLLSHHPNVLNKIRSEVSRVRFGSCKQVGETYTFDELRDMNYLQGAISEAMRLYPPVPVDSRVCRNEDVWPDGTRLKKDWIVTYHMYAMGRMRSIWGKDCMEYKPERWLDETGLYKPDNPFKYPIFNAGPRVCLGKDMAYIQMKSIVACVVEQFEFDVLVKKTRPEMLMSMTLRMKHGLPVKVIAKNNGH